MILADTVLGSPLVSTNIQVILAFIIVVLAGVITFLYRGLQKLQDKYDSIQEQRITDARETRDKITEPLEKQAIMSEKTHELLLSFINRRK